jgi:tetratricopeptide (TPR) repeat protein
MRKKRRTRLFAPRTRSWLLLSVLASSLGCFGGCAERSPDAVVEADSLFREGHLEAAASAYARLPEDASSWQPYGAWRAAVIYRDAIGDLTRAEKGFLECSSRFPMDSWGYACLVELGDLRRQNRRFRAAINSYRAALEQRPRGQHAEHCLLQSGHSYLALGEFDQARVEWQELAREFPASKLLSEVALVHLIFRAVTKRLLSLIRLCSRTSPRTKLR